MSQRYFDVALCTIQPVEVQSRYIQIHLMSDYNYCQRKNHVEVASFPSKAGLKLFRTEVLSKRIRRSFILSI